MMFPEITRRGQNRVRQSSLCLPLRGALILLLVVPPCLTTRAQAPAGRWAPHTPPTRRTSEEFEGLAERLGLVRVIISSLDEEEPASGEEGGWQHRFEPNKRRRRSFQVTEGEARKDVEYDLDPTYGDLSAHVWQRLNEIEDFWPISGRGGLWPGGRVPYVFAEEFDLLPLEKLLITWTMRNIESKSCVKFVARTTEPDYVSIIYDSYKCYSSVGRVGGEQPLSLGMFCSLFWDRGNIYHELLHAVGFYHEHTRPDRDDHVEVRWENIRAGMEVNFRKDARWTPQMLQMPYDVGSVMHYSSQAFSKMYLLFPTIVSREDGLSLTRKRQPSELDYAKLNRLYSCPRYRRRRASFNSRRFRHRGRALSRRSRRMYHPYVWHRLKRPLPLPSRKAFAQNRININVDQTPNFQ